MRGTILAFDFRTGEGKISGDDGTRYSFVGGEWHGGGQPVANQSVDFEAADRDALAVYPVRNAVGQYDRNRVAAALLAFFLGGLGVHKFYMGKPGAGVIMLLVGLFGWVLIFPVIVIWIVALVEFVIYLTMTDEAFDTTYIKGDKSWF